MVDLCNPNERDVLSLGGDQILKAVLLEHPFLVVAKCVWTSINIPK